MSYIGKGVETVTFNTATTLDVAGNITLGGTVDGRDVATDGTKLDTITSGAIADILQDTTPQLGGNLDLNTSDVIGTGNINVTGSITGTSFVSTGNMSFTNNSKAIFGTSPSLEIYHDGSNSILDDVGAGNFKMQLAGADKLEITSTGVDVTGNITVTGTVDGRDVAADGTKLDGIEAAADVTDATNVAAAGALMTTGGSVTGNVTFGDNNKAIFGAGSDLQIYHSGGASHIDDVGTGDFKISTDGAGIYLNKGGSENMASFLTDGAVTLYYDNAAKLATKATGAQINGQLDVQNTAGNVVTGVRATEFGYSSAYQVTQVGDTSGNKSVSIAYDPYTNTSGSFTGNGSEVLFRNGVEFMTPNSGNTGFYNNVLVMKDGNIGIGTSSPIAQSKLTVAGNSLSLTGSDANFGAGGVRGMLDLASGYLRMGAVNGGGSASGVKLLAPAGQEAVVVDTSGRVTMPYQPAFHAYGTTAAWTVFSNGGWSTIVLPATALNTGNHYNTASSAFTAPVAGVYHFYYKLYGRVQSGAPASTYWLSRFQKNNNAISGHGAMIMAYYYNDGGKDETATYSMTISLAANDQITLHAQSAGAYNGEYYPVDCEFGGYLIG